MYGSHDPGSALKGSVDAHQHFWHYDACRHSWITDDMAVIRRDFMPEDLQPVLEQNGVEACVAVQADSSEAETDFLLQLASRHAFIKGIVGWVDLLSAHAAARLAHYALFKKLKGFRHILQAEESGFMLQPAFLQGMALLQPYHFTYDILVYPHQLPTVLQLVKQFPQQPFVIDHLAKPYIKKGLLQGWKEDMAALAAYPNVHCKISGMVTEADLRNWKPENFTPYLNMVTELFGINRIMYGSDWPVCLAGGAYSEVMSIVKHYFSAFSLHEQQLFFGRNATAFYHLI